MKKLIFVFALTLSLTTFGCAAATPTAIQASGQIEAKQIAVTPELSGRVVEVSVNEGDPVKTGDSLFRLDASLYLSQKQVAVAELETAKAGTQTAQAALASAQAQYEMELSAALAADENNRQGAWKEAKPGEFNQPVWYFTKDEQIQSMQVEVDTARTALEEAQARLDEIEKKAGSARFLDVEKRLSDARVALDIAKMVFDHTNGAADGASLRDAAQSALDKTKTDLKNTQKEYTDTQTTDGAKDVLKARAEVEVAHERYDTAQDGMRALQTGENALSVVTAGKAVDQAKAMLAQAQSAVNAAQANLDQIDTQIAKLTIHAPVDGIILVSSIDVGEIAQAGMPGLTLAKLDLLKVTVYIPEGDYGRIRLGQKASLHVDSFPNETFTATVTRISDKAEFTPQNVQTKEGRQTTVYAVELSLANSNGKLKPGMPVDVVFENTAGKE